MNIAIIGATGMVGRKMLEVLLEKEIAFENIYLFSGKRSAGQIIKVKDREVVVEELSKASLENKKIDVAFFSAGADVSLEYAPIFVKNGAFVIDNSSAFRMDKTVPLIIPEVNPHHLVRGKKLIANPNCTTIITLAALNNIAKNYGLKKATFSTYQAISGAGDEAVKDFLENPENILRNSVIPFITGEEEKMVNETHKILGDSNIEIDATCIRIPVTNVHSISIFAQFKKPLTELEVLGLLENSKGVVVFDKPSPKLADNKNPVFVGRIRINNKKLNMFVAGDNIRKGAALNAVQILELLLSKDFITL